MQGFLKSWSVVAAASVVVACGNSSLGADGSAGSVAAVSDCSAGERTLPREVVGDYLDPAGGAEPTPEYIFFAKLTYSRTVLICSSTSNAELLDMARELARTHSGQCQYADKSISATPEYLPSFEELYEDARAKLDGVIVGAIRLGIEEDRTVTAIDKSITDFAYHALGYGCP